MKSLLIIGGSGTGKSLRAEFEAQKVGGRVCHTSWDDLGQNMGRPRDRFWLGRLLANRPSVVIVEGFRIGRGRGNTEFIKELISSEMLAVEVRGEDCTMVPAPMWIFVAQPPLVPGARQVISELGNSQWSRFMVIDMDNLPGSKGK